MTIVPSLVYLAVLLIVATPLLILLMGYMGVWVYGPQFEATRRDCARWQSLAETGLIASEAAADKLERQRSAPVNLSDRQALVNLRRQMVLRLSETELRNIVFDLGVDYDGVSGTTVTDKARELIVSLRRGGD